MILAELAEATKLVMANRTISMLQDQFALRAEEVIETISYATIPMKLVVRFSGDNILRDISEDMYIKRHPKLAVYTEGIGYQIDPSQEIELDENLIPALKYGIALRYEPQNTTLWKYFWQSINSHRKSITQSAAFRNEATQIAERRKTGYEACEDTGFGIWCGD